MIDIGKTRNKPDRSCVPTKMGHFGCTQATKVLWTMRGTFAVSFFVLLVVLFSDHTLSAVVSRIKVIQDLNRGTQV